MKKQQALLATTSGRRGEGSLRRRLVQRIRLTNPTYHFAAEFAEVGG